MFKPIDLFERLEKLKKLTKVDLAKNGRGFIIGAGYGATVVFSFFVLYLFFFSTPTKIGVVNITGIADAFIKTQAQSGVSSDELKKRVQSFGNVLEKTLHEVGAKKHAVLMPAEAVITGAKDYTSEVQKLLSKRLPDILSNQIQQEKQQLTQIPFVETPQIKISNG